MIDKNILLNTDKFLKIYFSMDFDNDKENLHSLQDAVDLIQGYKEIIKTNIANLITREDAK